jgi:hypothetical protein
MTKIQIDDEALPNPRQVLIHFKPRTPGTTAIPGALATKRFKNTTAWHPYSPSFEWWNFTTTVPISQGLSSFTVKVVDGGTSTTYSNGGNGFPLETDIIPQAQLSCGTVFMGRGYVFNLTVAVSLLRSPGQPVPH